MELKDEVFEGSHILISDIDKKTFKSAMKAIKDAGFYMRVHRAGKEKLWNKCYISRKWYVKTHDETLFQNMLYWPSDILCLCYHEYIEHNNDTEAEKQRGCVCTRIIHGSRFIVDNINEIIENKDFDSVVGTGFFNAYFDTLKDFLRHYGGLSDIDKFMFVSTDINEAINLLEKNFKDMCKKHKVTINEYKLKTKCLKKY